MQRSVLHVILSLEQEQILPYLKEAISSGEIGKQSSVAQVLQLSNSPQDYAGKTNRHVVLIMRSSMSNPYCWQRVINFGRSTVV